MTFSQQQFFLIQIQHLQIEANHYDEHTGDDPGYESIDEVNIGVQSSHITHVLIHLKSRNMLRHLNVQKLLFCYVNLRLFNKQYGKDDFFFGSIINGG